MFEAHLAAGLLALAAAGQGASVEELLRAADATRRVIEEGVVRIQATLEEPERPTIVSDLDVLVRGDDALCIFRGGPLQGRRILIAGGKTWLILPGTQRAIPISARQRLMGGASIADVARLWFAETYTGALRRESGTIDGTQCRVLDLEARTRKSQYATATLWIGAEDRLPRKALFHLASGAPAKEVLFSAYGTRQGKAILERMQIHHLLASERGHVTTLRYVGYEDRKLDPATFDPHGARSVP